MDIKKIENAYGIKLPSYVRAWLNKKWGKFQTSKQIPIRSKYNKSISFLLSQGIIEVSSIFPFYGYEESFKFTKSLFQERKRFTFDDFNDVMGQISRDLKEMGL